jgi:methionyl-tRNA formyltransferase
VALIFFGTPGFAVPSLDALLDAGEEVSLVVTQPDKVKGRGHVLSSPPVKERALSAGIRVLQPPTMRDEAFMGELRSIRPEFIIVVAFGRILPVEILSIPRGGCINVHASLLPRYRGAAPVQWALLNGEKVTGVTTMRMDEGLDTGDVLMQTDVGIDRDDTAETLSKKLSMTGARLLPETLRGLRNGTVIATPQTGEPTYAPPLKKEEGRIDWSKSAVELSFFVRAMHPWPVAFCTLGAERLRIVKASPREGRAVPGLIVKASQGEFLAGTGEGLLSIETLQPEGRKVMSAAAFLTGRRLREGHEKLA